MAKFNLQKWSAIAEILSSVAVLATLVFLVLEIRQTNDAVRANTYQGLNAVALDFNAMFISDPEVSEFISRSASEDHELEAAEKLRLRAFISSLYRHADNVHFQYELGMITERQMKSSLHGIVLYFRGRGRLRTEWENGEDKLLLNPNVIEYLNREIYTTLDIEGD